ncbi:hypothetical protein C8R44DRAFT_892972 [Mycena epipterygia]|nr:hypothetical protein C8R44DRAFT_892972 [Mycena epipterygia]
MGEFDATIGYTLLGAMINTYLTGIITSQFFTYWTTKYTDAWWIRALVLFLFVANATQAAAVVYMSWSVLLCNVSVVLSRPGINSGPFRNFANPQIVAIILWPYLLTAFMNAVLALVNQTFQSWRIYMFTKSKILVGFILAAALAACGLGIAAAILQSSIILQLSDIAALQPVVEANLALQCAVDVLLAIILSITFSRSKTTSTRTDRVLNRLIRTAIQSGFFTAVFALWTLLSFHFSPGTYMLALFALPIGRIYTHTMMDHFVCREELRNMLSNGGNIISVPNFNIISMPKFNIGGSGTRGTGGMGTMMALGNASSTTSQDPEANDNRTQEHQHRQEQKQERVF